MEGLFGSFRHYVLAAVAPAVVALSLAPALANAHSAPGLPTPGMHPVALPSSALDSNPRLQAAVRDGDPLLPFSTESGDISLSVDGIGTNNPAGGPVKVYKEFANETVRKAYLFAASTGATDYTPVNGDVTIDGTPVEWNPANTISSDIGSVNVESEVTSIVKAELDAAPAGYSEFTVAEPLNTYDMDGEILAVIFNNPNLKESNSVTLLYGAQNPLGDSFHVGLAEPVDKSNPAFALNLSLGISYGYEEDDETSQYSIIHVNGKLMTQMAGGQDDCAEKYSPTPDFADCQNGELLTVGGIGDSISDPNPNETLLECAEMQGEPVTRCDDELYSLLPFAENGETELTFETLNPSDNDNIFFGALETHANAAVVGEGVTLSPTAGTNIVGETHTLTATVQNAQGEKLSGKKVDFEVVSGPNAGLTGEGTTNSGGEAQFAYSSILTGTDHIVASFTNATDEVESSNEVTETWEVITPTITLLPQSGHNTVGESHTVTATALNEEEEPVAGTPITFKITAGPNAGLTGQVTSNSKGEATFTYSSTKTGTDDIVASFTTENEIDVDQRSAKVHKDAAVELPETTTYESNVATETWEEAKKAPAKKEETTTTATTAITTPPPAKGEVLAFGTAHLASSAKACSATSSYLASVGGKDIASVTFALNGHKLKTLSKANSHGAFSLRIPVETGKSEHLSIHVEFSSAASNHTQTINKTLARCAVAHPLKAPRFTG